MVDCSLRKALCAQPIGQFPFLLTLKWRIGSPMVLLTHHLVPQCPNLTWERFASISVYYGLQTSTDWVFLLLVASLSCIPEIPLPMSSSYWGLVPPGVNSLVGVDEFWLHCIWVWASISFL